MAGRGDRRCFVHCLSARSSLGTVRTMWHSLAFSDETQLNFSVSNGSRARCCVGARDWTTIHGTCRHSSTTAAFTIRVQCMFCAAESQTPHRTHQLRRSRFKNIEGQFYFQRHFHDFELPRFRIPKDLRSPISRSSRFSLFAHFVHY